MEFDDSGDVENASFSDCAYFFSQEEIVREANRCTLD